MARREAKFHRQAFSEYLADRIPGAELRVVEGADTIPFHAGDFDPILDHVEEFLTGSRHRGRTDRVLATVLFTDIVDSTSRAAELGDQRWLDLLTEHDRLVRAQIGRFRGEEVKMKGDGCVATFDGPARAVGCALTIESALEDIGITIRAGPQTGEIEARDGEVGGLGVHFASRVMGQAERGGVLVSSTVKELVVGSGIDFASCGTFSSKVCPADGCSTKCCPDVAPPDHGSTRTPLQKATRSLMPLAAGDGSG